jgi:hypothetical protein
MRSFDYGHKDKLDTTLMMMENSMGEIRHTRVSEIDPDDDNSHFEIGNTTTNFIMQESLPSNPMPVPT